MKRSDSGRPARERAERAQLADVILQRRRRPMVERTAACGCVFEETRAQPLTTRLQRNLAVRRRLAARTATRPMIQSRTRAVCSAFALRIGAIVIRRVRIRGTRLVALVKPSKREAIRRASPAGLRAREQTSGLSRREAFVLFVNAEVARLQQAAEMAGREIRFDPVAQSDQRSAGTREGRRDAWAQRDRPVVAKRLLPDQRHVRVRRAGDFDLIERRRRSRGSGGRLPRSPLRGRRRETARSSFSGGACDGADAGVIRNASAVRRDIRRRRAPSVRDCQPPRDRTRRRAANARGWKRSPGIESMSVRWSGLQLVSGSSVQQSCG